MCRFAAIACAVGLWALPAAAQPVSPLGADQPALAADQPALAADQPALAAQTTHCTPQERARCASAAGQRAIEYDLSCDACVPMPADVIASPPRDRSPQ